MFCLINYEDQKRYRHFLFIDDIFFGIVSFLCSLDDFKHAVYLNLLQTGSLPLCNKENGWGNEKRKNCHVLPGTNPNDIMKYCNENGAEVVLYKDKDGKWHLMTDPRYEGTYNYSPPVGVGGAIAHGVDDLIPWLFLGNSPDDTTNFDERWNMMLGLPPIPNIPTKGRGRYF